MYTITHPHQIPLADQWSGGIFPLGCVTCSCYRSTWSICFWSLSAYSIRLLWWHRPVNIAKLPFSERKAAFFIFSVSLTETMNIISPLSTEKIPMPIRHVSDFRLWITFSLKSRIHFYLLSRLCVKQLQKELACALIFVYTVTHVLYSIRTVLYTKPWKYLFHLEDLRARYCTVRM
jgi:hypothetical protein